jgi:hypothetical protein
MIATGWHRHVHADAGRGRPARAGLISAGIVVVVSVLVPLPRPTRVVLASVRCPVIGENVWAELRQDTWTLGFVDVTRCAALGACNKRCLAPDAPSASRLSRLDPPAPTHAGRRRQTLSHVMAVDGVNMLQLATSVVRPFHTVSCSSTTTYRPITGHRPVRTTRREPARSTIASTLSGLGRRRRAEPRVWAQRPRVRIPALDADAGVALESVSVPSSPTAACLRERKSLEERPSQ